MTSNRNDAEETCLKNHTAPILSDGLSSSNIRSKSEMNSDSETPPKATGLHHLPDATVTAATARTPDLPSSPASSEQDEEELTYPEGGLRAWLVVLGSFCGMFAVFGLINTSAVFEAYFKENQLRDYNHSQIGWIFSLYLFLVFFVGVLVGPVFDHYGSRLLVLSGSFLIVASLMLLSISREYYQIILTYSVMGGLGGALLCVATYGCIAHYFSRRRGLATGIATTAGGFGGILFPLLLQYLLGEHGVGFAWSCRILGFILLGLCAIAMTFLRGRLQTKTRAASKTGFKSVWPDFTILRNRGFALAAAGIFFMEWGLFVPLTYIVTYARTHGNGNEASSVILSLLNAGSVVGRVLPGFLADKVGRFNVIIGTISLCVITVMGLWLPSQESKPLLIVFAVLFGFVSGSNLGLAPVCIGQFCDSRDYGRYLTTANMIASFGTLTSVPIGGALLGLGGRQGWIGLIVFSGSAYIAALTCYSLSRSIATGWKVFVKF